jgi:hypothetical protein
MFNHKNKKTGCETPEFRSKVPMPPVRPAKPNPNFGWQPQYTSTQNPPSPPTSGSNAVKPNQNYILPNSIKVITDTCPLLTPCGWCAKWDKKCDKKICGYPTVDPTDKTPKSHAQKTIDYIKSGKGLPPLGFDDNFGLQTINERKPRK